MSQESSRAVGLAGIDFTNFNERSLRSLVSSVLNQRIHGLCFSPYTEGQGPGTILERQQVADRLDIVQANTNWIRSFSCTEGNEHIPRLAKERNLKTMVGVWLDEDEDTNLQNLLKLWNVFVKKPKVYTWRPPPDHPYTKLHAKCLVVDRLDALVTSANFTFHGLESNLELGLRVRGPQARAIAERFDHLIASDVLKPWKSGAAGD